MSDRTDTMWVTLRTITSLSWDERKRIERELEEGGWADPNEWYKCPGALFDWHDFRKRVVRTPENERMVTMCVLAGR